MAQVLTRIHPLRRAGKIRRLSCPTLIISAAVFDLAPKTRCQNRVGALDVSEVRGQERRLDLESSVFIDSPHWRFLVRANNEIFVAVPCDLKGVAWILGVHPFAQEFRSSGCATREDDDNEQVDADEAENQRFHAASPVVLFERRCVEAVITCCRIPRLDANTVLSYLAPRPRCGAR